MSFEEILTRIAAGESVATQEILPYLSLERREQRAEVNRLLAESYWRSARDESRELARVAVRRAWLLSDFALELLPLFVKIHSALDDIPAIRDAYKRAGMKMASACDVGGAISYFDQWQYAYHNFKKLDKYEYDFDILACMEGLARPHRLPHGKPRARRDAKVRVAYLVKGINELGSVLVKLNLLFARYHDLSRIEPIFFVPEAEGEVRASEAGRQHLALFEGAGHRLVMGPDGVSTEDRLLAVARAIHDARPDVLIVSAALATFEHLFLTALRPAPVIMGLVQGPPEQFAPPALDWGIAWSLHPMIDCPFDCTPVRMEMELPERSRIAPKARGELGIPDDARIVATAGRYVKFQDQGFWRAVVELLAEHPRLYYLALGVDESQIPFLPSLLTPEAKERVRFLSWRGDDYLRDLSLADVYLDTYPSGGGTVVTDAMALGIPVAAFRNDYLKVYDQTDWSPAQELYDVPELIVARGDFNAIKRVVSRLVTDDEFRQESARRCREHVLSTRGEPERGVHRCEEVILRVVTRDASGIVQSDPHAAEIESLRRSARRAPRWVADSARQLKRVLRFGERMLDRVAGF